MRRMIGNSFVSQASLQKLVFDLVLWFGKDGDTGCNTTTDEVCCLQDCCVTSPDRDDHRVGGLQGVFRHERPACSP